MKSSSELIAAFERRLGISLIRDGIIDPPTFEQSPFCILIIIKPVKSKDPKPVVSSLNNMLLHWIEEGHVFKYWRLTYNNLIVAIHAIVRQNVNTNVNECISTLKHCAIVSTDKIPQQLYSGALPPGSHAQQHAILKAQIKEIKPNIILCAGTYSKVQAILQELYMHSNFQKERIPGTHRKFWRGDPLIIDYHHPKYSFAAEQYAEGVLFAYKCWYYLKKNAPHN